MNKTVSKDVLIALIQFAENVLSRKAILSGIDAWMRLALVLQDASIPVWGVKLARMLA